MAKSDVLLQLRNAKKAHIKWVQRAHVLVEGLTIDKDAIPMQSTDCVFGEWFYGEGQQIALMPGMDCFKEIEKRHNELHEVYLDIYKIYFDESDKSFFAKVFNMKKRISQKEHDNALEFYARLKQVSEELLVQIEKLERRINAMSEELFS